MDALIGSLRGLWDALLHVMSTAPLGVSAPLVGMIGALGTTYAIDHWVIFKWLMLRWSDDGRKLFRQMTAFFAGLAWTWAFWRTSDGAIVGVLVGLTEPIFWRIVMWGMRKRWPDFLQGSNTETKPTAQPKPQPETQTWS